MYKRITYVCRSYVCLLNSETSRATLTCYTLIGTVLHKDIKEKFTLNPLNPHITANYRLEICASGKSGKDIQYTNEVIFFLVRCQNKRWLICHKTEFHVNDSLHFEAIDGSYVTIFARYKWYSNISMPNLIQRGNSPLVICYLYCIHMQTLEYALLLKMFSSWNSMEMVFFYY